MPSGVVEDIIGVDLLPVFGVEPQVCQFFHQVE